MIKKSVLAVALLSAICTQAEAITLNADGAWHAFDVDNSVSNSGGLEWIDLDNNALSFEFTLTGSAILRVVDAGFAGDRFKIFNAASVLGETSAAVNNYPTSVYSDFDLAYTTSGYSHGEFLLSAGSYQISGLLIESALDDTSTELNATVGAVSLTAVPLPAAAGLYAAGAGLLGLVSRRRKSTN
ncbi:hypothetical protein JWZ98_06155 [Methylomonas sp. EFPC1]|uniref:hypothetical protein n=1 Tax=Methylomonas sp. EFPC1 TaxID=2812647 RepID=UPI001966ED76|nr:hypothetical protein [Methylomonas sp. EFPC1]QSB02523.1 hypothetical protein JWZ98_06155 [Methylomonas sp. EFPC1]